MWHTGVCHGCHERRNLYNGACEPCNNESLGFYLCLDDRYSGEPNVAHDPTMQSNNSHMRSVAGGHHTPRKRRHE